jgi:hypothetical protein
MEQVQTATAKKRKISLATIATTVGLATGIISIGMYYSEWTTKDLSGHWKMTFHVESSSYVPYIGNSGGHKVFFTQNSEIVEGDGELWWRNEEELPFSQHIKLTFNGKVDGDIFKAKYVQYGEKRTTIGEVTLTINPEGTEMEGSFTGTAADTKGRVKAVRM